MRSCAAQRLARGATTCLLCLAGPAVARADAPSLPAHVTVEGTDITTVEVAESERPDSTSAFLRQEWSALATARIARGPRLLRFRVPPRSAAVEIPACAGRGRLWVDGREVATSAGPIVLPLPAEAPATGHIVEMSVLVGDYERRIPCSAPPKAGVQTWTNEGLGVLEFDSAHRREGGGRAVVFVPPGHDDAKPATVLVGTHPWNGGIWSYAAYEELLAEASAKDVVLLMPSGLGNSLYTAPAEDEVLASIRALESRIAVDAHRVSIWGASMGGAGATTIGFHHPDRFASVTSLFGDSRYDLSTYVRAILHDEAGAHLVNALDVIDNARYLPVWLIHGDNDKVSPPAQSESLADALRTRHFQVRFDRVRGAGHEGALVARYGAEIVDRASTARAPDDVARVTFTSVRASVTSAYGVRFERTSPTGDAVVDVEREGAGVRVHRADGISKIWLARGAFGLPGATTAATVDAGVRAQIAWDAPASGAKGNDK